MWLRSSTKRPRTSRGAFYTTTADEGELLFLDDELFDSEPAVPPVEEDQQEESVAALQCCSVAVQKTKLHKRIATPHFSKRAPLCYNQRIIDVHTNGQRYIYTTVNELELKAQGRD